jgi:hypothetical protein
MRWAGAPWGYCQSSSLAPFGIMPDVALVVLKLVYSLDAAPNRRSGGR